MPTLLIAEHDNSALRDVTTKALTAAKALGGEVHALVAGKDCKPVADAVAKLSGVAKVLLVESEQYKHALAEPLATLIVSLADPYDAIVAPATTMGKNVMPRAAALLDVMQVSDVTKIVAPDTFERPIYAGNAIQTVKATDTKKVMTVRLCPGITLKRAMNSPCRLRLVPSFSCEQPLVGELIVEMMHEFGIAVEESCWNAGIGT
jgi:electron transfer flavoprotein alpha subunit